MTRDSVVFVGAIPPPATGAANVNASLAAYLQDQGLEVRVVDTGSADVRRTWSAKVRRIPRVIGAVAEFLGRVRGRPVVYLSINGGLGQLYDLPFLLVSRLMGLVVYVHHHNYTYLDTPTWLMRLVVRLAGRGATHVVLCGQMRADLTRVYPRACRVYVQSNHAFAGDSSRARRREVVSTVGFLSNISAEKGIVEFLDLMDALSAVERKVRGLVAGPFAGPSVRRKVLQRIAQVEQLAYLGSLSPIQVDQFYRSIDVLVMPTRYPNEVQPLVIIEAQSRGVPVVAWERGCIRELGENGGVEVIERGEDFVAACLSLLVRWGNHPGEVQRASLRALAAYQGSREASFNALAQLTHSLRGALDRPRRAERDGRVG
jgi:glycosyltransferase involved in cell wall biosynthesis